MFNNIAKQLNRISNICGLKLPSETAYSSLNLLKDEVKKSTKGASPFYEFVSYRYYNPSDQIFTNEAGVLGFMIEIAPIVGENKDLEKNLNLFFNSELPQDSYLQFLLIASYNIEQKLNFWADARNKSGIGLIEFLTQQRASFLRKKSKDFAKADGRIGRDFRIYLSFSSKKGAANSQTELDNVRKFQKKIIKKFETLSLSPHICGATDLIQIGREIVQMGLEHSAPKKHNFLNPLNEQIFKPLTAFEIRKDDILHHDTGMISKIFYPTKLPDEFSLMEMIELLGSGREGANIPARFLISYSLASNISNAEKESILTQGRREIHAAEQSYTRHESKLKKIASEWIEVINRHKEGEKFLSESLQIMITTTSNDLEIAEENIRSIYNINDWEISTNRDLQLPCLISILPMEQSRYWRDLTYFKMVKKVQSREVVAKLPIHGEWKGSNRSGVLLLGRRGEIFNWNPFDRLGGAGNFNSCVMGPSGSGKSVFLEELTTSLISQNIPLFILDIGGSYQNICDYIKGESIKFNSQSAISLNPFSALAETGKNFMEYLTEDNNISINEEKIEVMKIGSHYITKDGIIYAKNMISAMCGVQGNAHKEALIERGITSAIEKYGSNLDISKLAETLLAFDSPLSKELSETLYPYTDKGIHGKFFKQGRQASFKELITLFEFEEIKNDEVLLSVILQVILMQITMQFLCGDRARQFMIIVDEAWKILDFCSTFLESFARTVRKYGGALVTCVQDLGSFQKGPSQKAIFNSSSWKIILKQTSIKSFEEEDEFKDYIPLIESLSKESSNKYAELLISTSGLMAVGRLVLDPFSKALYSTESEDFNFTHKLKEGGLTTEEAIMKLARKYEAREEE